VEALDRVAFEANDSIPSWIPQPFRGLLVHYQFDWMIESMAPEYQGDVSYVGGRVTFYGYPGSSRADAIFGPEDAPLFAYELKTGGAYVTKGQLNNYKANLPSGTPLVELRIPPSPTQ
jgi:hypothetical protein